MAVDHVPDGLRRSENQSAVGGSNDGEEPTESDPDPPYRDPPKPQSYLGLSRLNATIACLYLSAVANGYCSTIVGGVLNIDSFRAAVGITDSFPMSTFLFLCLLPLGAFFSLIPAGVLSDKIGRRHVLYIGCIIMVVFSFLLGYGVQGGLGICVSRFMVGVGLGVSQVAAPTLALEIAAPRNRNKVGILYNAFWYLGSVIGSGVTMGFASRGHNSDSELGWRIPFVLKGLFPLLQIFGYLCPGVPESPRWLISVGRDDEAWEVLMKFHQTNPGKGASKEEKAQRREEDLKAITQEFYEIKAILKSEEYHARLARGVKLPEYSNYHYEGMHLQKPHFREYLGSWGNFRRLFTSIFVGGIIQFAGNGVVGWYLYPSINKTIFRNQIQAATFNFVLQIWNLFWATVGAILSSNVGRRPLWIITTLFMMVPLVAIGIIAKNASNVGSDSGSETSVQGYCIMASVMIFWAIYDLAYTPLQVGYVIEVLPFRLRSTGLAFNWTSVMAFGIVQQFTSSSAMQKLGGNYYFVNAGLLLFFAIIMGCTFPETRDVPLPFVQFIFEKTWKKRIGAIQAAAAKGRAAAKKGIAIPRGQDVESLIASAYFDMENPLIEREDGEAV
ncbi:hypothetical protein TWF481_004389 [Arthrobotrys musiformis]|uniref:Major facilitator superfamily (MFS) profile domain-containing protein n=1 Tax=Arthrobotrys musiformis TaxID=47236 RepID=A0AAV9WJF8_9PEZI